MLYGILSGGYECPLMAISGHAEGSGRESALPPKADIEIVAALRLLVTLSGHCAAGPIVRAEASKLPDSGYQW